jgi:phosphohistidine phosphatase
MRHAKSAWDTGAPTDFERPLSDRGAADAPVMGHWLYDEGLVPDRVIASPAMRAKQTVQLAASMMFFPSEDIIYDERIYAASLSTLCEVLSEQAGHGQRLMMVGHNPGFDDLLGFLCPRPLPFTNRGKLMTTANIAHIKIDAFDDLHPGKSELIILKRPKDLI